MTPSLSSSPEPPVAAFASAPTNHHALPKVSSYPRPHHGGRHRSLEGWNIYLPPPGVGEVEQKPHKKTHGGCFQKIGVKHPKLDGLYENNGTPYKQMDDLGGKPTIFGNIHLAINYRRWNFKFHVINNIA